MSNADMRLDSLMLYCVCCDCRGVYRVQYTQDEVMLMRVKMANYLALIDVN